MSERVLACERMASDSQPQTNVVNCDRDVET